MEPTPTVMNPLSNVSAPTATSYVSRMTRRKWQFLFLLLGLALVGAALVYAVDPWNWRRLDRAPNAAFYWDEAQKAMDERDFGLAQQHLSRCLETWPLNAEAHFLMARACRREQGPLYQSRWRKHLIEAAQLEWPKDQINFEIQLQQAQMGDVWSVESSLKEALKTKPDAEVDMILEALAEGYLKNHSLAKILELTGPWIDRSPEDWLPHLYRGHIEYRDGSRSRAIEEYRTVLKLNPEHAAARLLLAGALMDDGQFKDALALFEKLVQEDPGDVNALFGIASCQYSLSKTAAARAALKEIFAVSKDDIRALFLQAKIEFADDQPEESLKWLRKAERLAPKESDITHTMIVVLQRLGRSEEAEKYVKRQQEILDLHDQLMKARKLLRREPSNAELHFQLGKINAALGRDDEAFEWFQSALRLNPTHAETLKAIEEWKERNPDAVTQGPK